MLMVNQLVGFGAGGSNLSPFEFEVTDTSTANIGGASSHTFTSQAFGVEPIGDDKRYIAVAIAAAQNANRSISAVTIGGVSASLIVGTGANHIPRGIYVAEVPTGTTGSVAITFDGSIATVGIAVCRLLNPADPLGFDSISNVHSSTVIDLSINIPTGGSAIGVAHAENGLTTTWTGLTELLDVDLNSGEYFTAASGGSPGTPTTITADNAQISFSLTSYAGVAASWGPA